MTAEDRAAQAYEDFTGDTANETIVYNEDHLPAGKVIGYKMGTVDGVSYVATRDGVTEAYFHQFEPEAAPDLIATHDGRGILLAGGDYCVTDHGIEDFADMQILALNPSKRGHEKDYVKMARRKTATKSKAKSAPKTKEVTVYVPNPSKPRRRRRAQSKTPVKVVYRKRNPSMRGGKLQDLLVAPIMQAGGGIAASIAVALLPVNATYKTGPMGFALKAGLGLGLGMALSKVNKSLAKNVTQGALVIAAYDYMRTLVPKNVPIQGFVDNPMAGFVSADDAGLGAFTPAQVYPYETDFINR